MRVLVVEDTPDVAEGIVAAIRRLGHVVDWAADGRQGEDVLATTQYDLIVLDLMLPGVSGTSLLRGMRARGVETPVLVLTARSAIDERVQVLDLGADDYLCKPFDFAEMQARVRSLLRRRAGDKTNRLSCGRLLFDRATRATSVDGQTPLALSPRELSLLELLLVNRSRILSKAQLLERLFDWAADPNDNAVEVLVGRLRRKVVVAGVQIINHRGLGYQIRASE